MFLSALYLGAWCDRIRQLQDRMGKCTSLVSSLRYINQFNLMMMMMIMVMIMVMISLFIGNSFTTAL